MTKIHKIGNKIVTSRVNVNARVFTNQMWTDGRGKKNNPKTSPEQSVELKSVFHRSEQFSNMMIGHEIFELDQDFTGTKLLTKFYEDRTRNVASGVFTNKC
ncbi:hypothetical protein DPMN_005088 [Dreissena polymorpha]|uniref:Uncharacterized protein n=1 Tax=Dreissena polymorpha TaxID=45954 RepID=A0A9D4MPP4_DREPO|nr:hypothetical protein DPMN_005088 [Dreissena polymorpha]